MRAWRQPDFVAAAVVVIAMLGSLTMMIQNLGHPGLKGLDESFHAVVAESLLRHPLKPTLYDEPYLVRPDDDWQSAHVWLHKPTLPLWQIAICFKILGITSFALRFPSALLTTLSAMLTFLTGRRIFGPIPAAVPAVIQAFLPAIWMLVYGYAFSDAVDIAMLFYVQLGMYLLVRAVETQRTRDFVFCGIAQGLAWMSKSHPAFIITGVAIALWILPRYNRFGESKLRVFPKQIGWFLLATVITIAPWTVYTAIVYPQPFVQSQLQVLSHLSENVEQFAAPWDRLLFNYWPQLTLYFYPVGLACMVITARAAWRERNPLLLVPLLWWIGFMIPHILATTKTPSQTTPAVPALLLMIGIGLRELLRRDVFAGTALLSAALLTTFWRPAIPTGGLGTPADYTPGKLAIDNIWIIIQPAIALVIGASALKLIPNLGKQSMMVMVGVLGACLIFNLYRAGKICLAVTQLHPTMPTYTDLGPFVRANLPGNAVLLVEERSKLERNTLMFYTGRNAYAATPETEQEMANEITARGGVPYLVTSRLVKLPLLSDSKIDGRRLYAVPR